MRDVRFLLALRLRMYELLMTYQYLIME